MAADYKFRIVGQDATKKAFASIKRGLGGVRSGVNSTAVKMGLMAGAAGMGLIVKASLQTIDAMGKMSDRLNITTEDLAAMHHMTQLNGESTESFDKALEKMTRGIGEAKRGLGTAKIALEQMGIKLSDIEKLDAGKQFEVISEAIASQDDQMTKASLSADIFGRAGIKLLNTINQGAEGIAEARDEVEQYGLALSRVDAAKVEDANDQLLRVKQVATGLGQQLTVKLAPMISVIAERFIKSATEGDRMGKIVSGSINFIVKTVGIFADGLRGIDIIWTALKVGGQLFAAGVMMSLQGIIKGAIAVGQILIDAILMPLTSALTLAAQFSDTAANALKELEAMTTIPEPAFLLRMNDGIDSLIAGAGSARDELQALLLKDLPSSVIDQKWAEIEAEAEIRAAEVARKIQEQLNNRPAEGEGEEIRETDAQVAARERSEQRERDAIAAKLLRLDESHFTELEKIAARQLAETELVQAGLEARLLTEDEAREKTAQADEDAAAARLALETATQRSKMAMIGNAFGMLANIQNSGSKKLFKVQKAAAMAQAAVALPAAVIDAIRNGGGLPWGAIPGAITLAAGLAQIAQIRKQTFGGAAPGVSFQAGGGGGGSGGSGGSGGGNQGVGGLPAGVGSQFNQGPGVNQAGQQNITHITISGDVVGDSAELMIDKLKTLINDGDTVLIDPNSRQAQEIAATAQGGGI
jgi:hypothetical protein